jgi:hypothetical protein
MIVSEKMFKQEKKSFYQARYDRLMAKASRLSKKLSPPEYEQNPVVKVH